MMGDASAEVVNGQGISSILRFVERTRPEMSKQDDDKWMCRIGPIIHSYDT
jgi:hypothetical protein